VSAAECGIDCLGIGYGEICGAALYVLAGIWGAYGPVMAEAPVTA
jgi:hypothetical protein